MATTCPISAFSTTSVPIRIEQNGHDSSHVNTSSFGDGCIKETGRNNNTSCWGCNGKNMVALQLEAHYAVGRLPSDLKSSACASKKYKVVDTARENHPHRKSP